MKIVLLFIIFHFSFTLACEFNPHSHLYIFNENQLKSYIKKSTQECTKKETEKLFELLIQTTGTISKNHLKRFNINLHQKHIKLYNALDVIQDVYSSNEDLRVVDIQFSLMPDNIYSEESVSFTASSVSDQGDHSVRLKSKNSTYWANISVAKKIEVYFAKNNIKAYSQKLHENQFTKKIIYTKESLSNHLTDLKKIHFYKANKNIKKGENLRKNMLSPLKLVKYGKVINLKFNNNILNIKTKAKATQSGSLGDIITLKNIKTNKTITGRITNFNEVEIDI